MDSKLLSQQGKENFFGGKCSGPGHKWDYNRRGPGMQNVVFNFSFIALFRSVNATEYIYFFLTEVYHLNINKWKI